MSRTWLTAFLLLCIVKKHQVTPIASLIGDVQTVANFANDAMAFFKGELPLENLIMGSTGHALEQIMNKMDAISDTLEQMEANNERRMNHMINTLMKKLPLQNRIDSGMTELHSYMVRIDGMYEHFIYYVKERATFTNRTIMGFIEAVTSHDSGDLPDVLDNLYRLMMPGRSSGYKTGLPELVRQKEEDIEFESRCYRDNSLQQRLFQIYNAVVISESRAFAMTVFAYALLMAYTKESYKAEMQKAAAQLVLRSQEYITATELAMRNSSTIVERCDVGHHKRGKTFHELEGVMQKFVIAEADIASEGSCTGTCGDLWAGWVNGCYNYEDYCPVRTCYGYMYNCESLAGGSMCELPPDFRRRYDWVKSSGSTYGNPNDCRGEVRRPQHWNRGFVSCDICFCDCAEQMAATPATRSISLRPQLSTIDANMVVIGIKFISSNKMIQIQIQEGELISGGRIKPDSNNWIPHENYAYVQDGSYGGTFELLEGTEKKPLYINEDFAFIRYYQKRIHLDDVEAPFGYVVTGIKFHHVGTDSETWNETPLQIRIHVTKFDFHNGTLSTDKKDSYWLNAKDDGERKRVTFDRPDDPTKGRWNAIASGPNAYIEFQTSDAGFDAGQSTVPFFDGEPVWPTPLTPLSGIGLYHKGAKYSGGFLAFRIMTLNMPGYLNTQLTQDMIDKYKSKYSGRLPYKL